MTCVIVKTNFSTVMVDTKGLVRHQLEDTRSIFIINMIIFKILLLTHILFL